MTLRKKVIVHVDKLEKFVNDYPRLMCTRRNSGAVRDISPLAGGRPYLDENLLIYLKKLSSEPVAPPKFY